MPTPSTPIIEQSIRTELLPVSDLDDALRTLPDALDELIAQVKASMEKLDADSTRLQEARSMNQGGLNLLTNLKNGGYRIIPPAVAVGNGRAG